MQASTSVHKRSRQWRELAQAHAAQQQGKCGICEKDMDSVNLDYDPGDKHVRGVLCAACKNRLSWSENYAQQIETYKKIGRRFAHQRVATTSLKASARERTETRRQELLQRLAAEGDAFGAAHPGLAHMAPLG